MKPKEFEVIYKFTVTPTVPFPSALNWNAEPIGELIRCKDCKHRVSDENGNARICNHPNNNAWNISDMHYCGYAERRGEE